MKDYAGQQIGNYRLLLELASGAFGSVYLAQHSILTERRVAVKVLHTYLHSAQEREQFVQEARFLEQLKHPHILPLLDVGISNNLPYLVLEYAPGGSLRHLLKQAAPQPLSTERVLSILAQIGQALQYAHQKGIIHRDLKPENILFTAQGEALLADFGIAMMLATVSMKYVTVIGGTPSYMAPEQFRGIISKENDQYALGCLAYELFTGRPPFSAPDFVSMGFLHATEEPKPLTDVNPTLPLHIQQAVLTAMAKQREQRYPDVATFIARLSLPSPDQTPQPVHEEDILTILSTKSSPGASGEPPEPAREDDTPTALSTRASSTQEVVIAPAQTTEEPAPAQKTSKEASLSPGVSYDWQQQPTMESTSATVSKQLPPTQIPEMVTTRNRQISRRTVLASLALLAAGSGVAWYEFSHHSAGTPPLGTLLYTYHGHSDEVLAVSWSPDGRRIASVSFGDVQVWDAADGGHVFTYSGHSGAVFAVAWSPDGRRIASGGDDKTVQVWGAADGGHVFTYHGHSSNVFAVAWSPDGRRIASGSDDKTVQVWDATDGGHVFTYHGHAASSTGYVQAVAWSPDGRRIASGGYDNTVQVWDAANGGHVFTYHGDAVFAVAWSPDGRRIALGSIDKTVQVWDAVDGGHVFTYHGHSDDVFAVAWSPDGRRIASGSFDKTVQVWDAANGGHVFTYHGHSDGVFAVAWSPDGRRIASGGYDKTVQMWEAV